MFTEEGHRNGIIHIIPMIRTIIRTTKRMIAREVHVQSHLRMFTCVILSHYLTALTFFGQQSHIDAWYIARLNASHNGRFRSSKFHTNTFQYSSFLWQQFRSKSTLFGRANILLFRLVCQLWRSYFLAFKIVFSF